MPRIKNLPVIEFPLLWCHKSQHRQTLHCFLHTYNSFVWNMTSDYRARDKDVLGLGLVLPLFYSSGNWEQWWLLCKRQGCQESWVCCTADWSECTRNKNYIIQFIACCCVQHGLQRRKSSIVTIQKGITVPRHIGDIANKEMATLKQISEKPPAHWVTEYSNGNFKYNICKIRLWQQPWNRMFAGYTDG